MENHYHHFLGSNPLRDFLSGLNDSCFLALLPKAIGWITQASKDRETHRKRQSWVSSVGELGVGWFTNERPGGSPFPAVFSLVNQEGLVFADPL